MGSTVEWYSAQHTSASVQEHDQEVIEDDADTLVTGEAAVVFSGDSVAVIEGDLETLLHRFRFVVDRLECMQQRRQGKPCE